MFPFSCGYFPSDGGDKLVHKQKDNLMFVIQERLKIYLMHGLCSRNHSRRLEKSHPNIKPDQENQNWSTINPQSPCMETVTMWSLLNVYHESLERGNILIIHVILAAKTCMFEHSSVGWSQHHINAASKSFPYIFLIIYIIYISLNKEFTNKLVAQKWTCDVILPEELCTWLIILRTRYVEFVIS